jgi:energy-coupling factor transport system ATP-binding protein
MSTRATRALADVGLAELGERSPYELSGGQQQRLALAGLLAMDPAVLVLDEPTGMLDPQGCREVYALLERLQGRGKAIVLAEHRLEWLAERADRIVLLAQGQVVVDGPPAEVLASESARQAGWTYYTQAAGRLAQRGYWPGGRPLPVTLPAAVEGFRALKPPGEAGAVRIATPEITETTIQGNATTKSIGAGIDIRLHAVTFAYPGGPPALNGIDVQISAGACAALIGANGSGKSTLARCLIGLARPQRGQVWLGDWNAAEHSPAQLARRAAYVFQNPDEQIFGRSVWEEVAFGPRNLGCGRAEIEARVLRALEQAGLHAHGRTNPRDLDFSGRKRVALASALAMETPILALDEPTVGLDAAEIERLGQILAALRQQGKTVLLITHDLDFAAGVCDWALLLTGGRLARHGAARKVLADVADLEAHGLIAPQMARLGRALGQSQPATTVTEMIEAVSAGL